MIKARIATAGALVALGAILGWAANVLLRPPPPLPDGSTYSLVEVKRGELSRSITLNAVAAWSGGDPLVNQAGGVLTQRLVNNGEKVAPGDVLYSVDLGPVAVAVGNVPAFRSLAPGVRGDDVSQLQQMLMATGHRTTAPTGDFDSATLEEYKEWQREVGYPATGTVPLGSLVFVPRLPAVVKWNDQATSSTAVSPDLKGIVGTRLAEGDVVADLLPPEPTFSIDLPSGQRKLVTPGMPVALTWKKYSWKAIVQTIGAPREDGSAVATLAAPPRAERICGTRCEAIDIAGNSSITALITVLAPRRGAIVPDAALVVAPDGSTAVMGRDGETIPATVLTTSGGQAIIRGVPTGTEIRVPGEFEQGG